MSISSDFTTFLPNGILSGILSHVPKVDYPSLSLVCKKINSLLSDEILWIPKDKQRYVGKMNAALINVMKHGNFAVLKTLLVASEPLRYEEFFMVENDICTFTRAALKRKDLRFLTVILDEDIFSSLSILNCLRESLSENLPCLFEQLLKIKDHRNVKESVPFVEEILTGLLSEKKIKEELLEIIYKNEHWDLINEIFDMYIVPTIISTNHVISNILPTTTREKRKLYNNVVLIASKYFGGEGSDPSVMLAMTYGVEILRCIFSFQTKYDRDYITQDQLGKAAKSGVALIRKMIAGNERYKNKWSDKNLS